MLNLTSRHEGDYELMLFPSYRLRRLRGSKTLRKLVRETAVNVDDLVMPLFVRSGKGVKKEIGSMKGNYQMSRGLYCSASLTPRTLRPPALTPRKASCSRP
jgi:hypothetical protein